MHLGRNIIDLVTPADTRRLIAARLMPVGMATYSQSGEDRIIDFFVRTCGLQSATYIDAGSSHPIIGNNTYLLYRRGLRGVCIDPTPGLPMLYRKYRPGDIFLPYALIPGEEKQVAMQLFEESTINTVSLVQADQFASFGFARHASAQGTETRVPAINLAGLCSENGAQCPDVLCLDIEGLDLAVVSGIDFEKMRPKLICVEAMRYLNDKTPIVENGFARLLLEKGYVKYADTHINQFFVDETFRATQKLL